MPAVDDGLFGAEHVSVYRETAGEHGYHWRGTTILLLTTTGHSSGQPRTTPLIHRTALGRGRLQGWRPRAPGVVDNSVANPQAMIQVRSAEVPVTAAAAT